MLNQIQKKKIRAGSLTPDMNVGLSTDCPGGNMPDFGRMFLTLKYTDITQNTYVYPKFNGYGDNGERILKV